MKTMQLWLVIAAFAARTIVCQREIGITGPEERALELSQDPSLLELAARTGESVQITISDPTVTAIVQEGVNANIWCLPLLNMIPEGTIQWSRLPIDSLTGEIRSDATPTDLNPGDSRLVVGGEDNEWLNITRTLVATGAEIADSAVYTCEVCTDRGAVNESCIESNVTLFIIGAPPIIDAADNNTVFEDPPSEVKVGADFCIPPNSNRSYTLLCDLNDAPEDIDGDGTIDIPRAFPNPSRAWLFNNDLIYQALINEDQPNIRDTDPTFFLDPPERMLLFPGVVSPNVLSTVGGGGILINLEARNISNPDMLPSSVTDEIFRMVLLEQVVGEWTCEANNTFGNDTATTTITICDDDECELGTDNCSQFAMCTNNIGSFTCDCLPGFVGDGMLCNDTNECLEGTDNCSMNADCINSVGGFSCECMDGFFGNGITCEAIQCPNLTVPVNGMVSYDMGAAATNNFDIGTVAMYECNDGFTLVGVESRNCTEGDGNSTVGTWTGEDPTCQSIQCPALDDLINGMIEYTNDTTPDFDLETEATHTCLPGFSLMGNEIRICEDDDQADTVGVWSGTTPTCEPIECPALNDLINGTIVYANDTMPDFDLATTATHTCLPGFSLVGNEIRICEDDDQGDTVGVWSGTAPSCEPIIIMCPALDYLANGMIVYAIDTVADFDLTTTATHSCVPGYALVGNVVRTCEDDDQADTVGVWSGTAPSCEPIECPALNDLINGTIVYANDTMPDFDLGTTATHTCLPGFSLVGNEIRICEDDDQGDTVGVWSGTAPSCEPIMCPALDDLANGMIVYAIDTVADFDLTTTATHSCLPGYALVGNVVRTCEDDDQADTVGVWSGTAPSCEPIQCPALDALTNGMIGYTNDTVPDFDLGTEAIHTCLPGFSLVGNEIRTCEDDDQSDTVGVWSGTVPSCEPIPIQCPTLGDLVNGMIVYANDSIPDFDVGTVATHSCDDGFSLVGNEKRVCEAVNQENITVGVWCGNPPICEPIQCPVLNDLVNGTIEYAIDSMADFDLGTVATHSCNDGFSLVGNVARTCQDDDQADTVGVWNGTAPSCESTDVNECELKTDNCSRYAKCTNTIGSFTCTCKPGFKGNGVTCKAITVTTPAPDDCEDETSRSRGTRKSRRRSRSKSSRRKSSRSSDCESTGTKNSSRNKSTKNKSSRSNSSRRKSASKRRNTGKRG